MRNLASIQKIQEIQPIEGADLIERVRINGWWVVVAKDANYKVGDLVVYHEVDSMLPEYDGNTPYQFLIDKSSRVRSDGVKVHVLRTVKLRGQLSQGFVLPVDMLLDITTVGDNENLLSIKSKIHNSETLVVAPSGTLEGINVTEVLGIEKYEKPLPASLSGMARGNFPSFIRKTDEDRIQNLTNDRELFRRIAQGEKWEVTEKLDGSSETIYFVVDEEQDENRVLDRGRMGVCSRNLDLKETEDNTFWQVARRYFPADGDTTLKTDSIARHWPIALQGELMASNIQGGSLENAIPDVFIFNVFDIKASRYMPPVVAREMVEYFQMKYVPVIHSEFVIPSEYTMDRANDLVQYLLDMASGPMAWNKKKQREGLVFMSADGQYHFKVISNSWLLKNQD